MARATYSQPSVRPRSTPLMVLGSVGLAVLVSLVLAFSGPGAALIHGAHWFLEYYAGVFSLVSLSITVMAGLAATDRVVLMVRHRILLQVVHRATALTSMTFLAVHIVLKILEGHAGVVDAVVPFLATHRAVYVGLG